MTPLRTILPALVISLIAASVVLSCSASPASPQPPPTSIQQGAPTPVPAAPTNTAPSKPAPAQSPTGPAVSAPTGDLKVGLADFGGGALDPQKSTANAARAFGSAIFDSLVGVTLEGRLGPGIAERWDMSPDAKVWTFYIRKNVKFHDGSDLTGDDVKFSIERMLTADATSSYAANLKGVVDKVEIRDNFTVLVNLKKPDPELLQWLSLFGGSEGAVVPKKYIEAKGVEYFRNAPVGSGPWKFVKYDNNVSLELEAVTTHWRATPKFKRLIIQNIPEESTRVAMLKTGGLDLIQITPSKVDEIKAAGLGIATIEDAIQSSIVLYPDFSNIKGNPVGDVRVRKALSLAINKQEIADKLFAGYAKPNPFTGMVSANMYFDSNVLKADPYDPTQAKALLAEAGYLNGFNMKLYPAMLTPWMNLLAEATAGYLDKIGVKVKLDVRDWAAVRPLIFPQLQPDMIGNALTMHTPPYVGFALRQLYHSNSFHKNTKNEELDGLIDKTEATIDLAERKKLALQTAVVAKAQYSYSGIVDVDELLGMSKTIGKWTTIKGFSIPSLEYEKVPRSQ